MERAVKFLLFSPEGGAYRSDTFVEGAARVLVRDKEANGSMNVIKLPNCCVVKMGKVNNGKD
jgi:hypothetical protein